MGQWFARSNTRDPPMTKLGFKLNMKSKKRLKRKLLMTFFTWAKLLLRRLIYIYIHFIFKSFFLFRSLLPAGQRAAFSDETYEKKVV